MREFTFPTPAAAIAEDKVLARVRMTRRAVCFGGVPRIKGLATQQIGSAVHRLNVSRIDAGADPAQVVKVQTGWDWPNPQGVGGPVCESRLSGRNADDTIAVLIQGCLPTPAPRLGIDPNLRLDPLPEGHPRISSSGSRRVVLWVAWCAPWTLNDFPTRSASLAAVTHVQTSSLVMPSLPTTGS